MKVYISNALSLQMLPTEQATDLHIWPMTVGSVREFSRDHIQLISAIGHADTAAVVSSMIGQEIQAQRINISLKPGDILIVAQLLGGRLPEGSTTLPDGYAIRFFGVQIKEE